MNCHGLKRIPRIEIMERPSRIHAKREIPHLHRPVVFQKPPSPRIQTFHMKIYSYSHTKQDKAYKYTLNMPYKPKLKTQPPISTRVLIQCIVHDRPPKSSQPIPQPENPATFPHQDSVSYQVQHILIGRDILLTCPRRTFFLGTGVLGHAYWNGGSSDSFSVYVSMYIRGTARVLRQDLPIVWLHRAV